MALRAITIVNLEQNMRASISREIAREMHHQDVSSSSDDSTPETQENIHVEIDIAGDGGNDTAEQTDTTTPDTTDNHDDETPNPVTVSIEECPDIPTNDSVIDGLERQIAEMSRESEQADGCCKFYRSNIVGHFISGIMTGALFVLIGVIFTVNSSTFPVYVGIILIVMGLVPCCLAVNRYRYMRIYQDERRQAIARLRTLRRMHRRHQRDRGRRSNVYPDLPPSYDNLGFNPEEYFQIDIELGSRASTLSRSSEFILPSYEEFMKKNENKGEGEESTSVESTEEAENNYLTNNDEAGTSREINNFQGETEETELQRRSDVTTVHVESDTEEDQERVDT